jgi:cell division protein FtsN
LAVGAVVGSYFVGFFQGNYVGFETGRGASGVEVPKLAVTDTVPEPSAEQSPSLIYDKLHTTTSTLESEVPAKKPTAASEERLVSKIAQDIKLADEERKSAGSAKGSNTLPKEQDDVLPLLAPSDDKDATANEEIAPVLNPSDAGIGGEPDIFDPEAGAESQSNVRMLGSAGGEVAPAAPSDRDKTLGAILDERIDSARSVTAPVAAIEAEPAVAATGVAKPKAEVTKAPVREIEKVESEPVKQPSPTPTRKPVPTPEKKAAGDVAVKKVVPSGFFAQVAAPTKRADAESVARKLKKSGFPVVVEEATVNGESYYRVLVGPEDNKVQADRLIQQLQSERYLSSVPFVRRVK